MLTIEQAANAVGLSTRQLRRRIEATSPLLAPHIRRGEKNRLLLDQGAVEILRAIEDRRASGATLSDASEWVAISIAGKQGGEQGNDQRETAGSTTRVSNEAPLVDELRSRIRYLEQENQRLWNLVDDLKALPAPRSRRGLFGLFRRRTD